MFSDILRRKVNATEGAIIYGISKSRIMVLASEAGAVYKVGNSALINTDIFEMYLEKFKEPTRPLPNFKKQVPATYIVIKSDDGGRNISD